MGGGDGGVIVKEGVRQLLVNPEVHGRLPAAVRGLLDAVLYTDATNTTLRDPSEWSVADRDVVVHAIDWAVRNL